MRCQCNAGLTARWLMQDTVLRSFRKTRRCCGKAQTAWSLGHMDSNVLRTFIFIQRIPQELGRDQGALQKNRLPLLDALFGEETFPLKHEWSTVSVCTVSRLLLNPPTADSQQGVQSKKHASTVRELREMCRPTFTFLHRQSRGVAEIAGIYFRFILGARLE